MKLNVLLGDAYKEGMTAEDYVAAIEKLPDIVAENKKLHDSVTKANSEAAEYKKQLKAKRTDDENAAQEQADKFAELQKQNEEYAKTVAALTKEKTIATYKAEFVKQGYEAELADKAANALADNDTAKLFKCQSEFMSAHDTSFKASLLKDMPTPPGADGNGNSDNPGVAFAKRFAQERADASKASSDAMTAFH